MTHCNPGADSLSDSAASYQLLTNNAIDKHFLFILFTVLPCHSESINRGHNSNPFPLLGSTLRYFFVYFSESFYLLNVFIGHTHSHYLLQRDRWIVGEYIYKCFETSGISLLILFMINLMFLKLTAWQQLLFKGDLYYDTNCNIANWSQTPTIQLQEKGKTCIAPPPPNKKTADYVTTLDKPPPWEGVGQSGQTTWC